VLSSNTEAIRTTHATCDPCCTRLDSSELRETRQCCASARAIRPGETRRTLCAHDFKGTIENTVIEQVWATRQEVDAIYTAMEEWSEQPSTFAAFVLCSGLGWAPTRT